MKLEKITINNGQDANTIIPDWLFSTCYYLKRNRLLNNIKKALIDNDSVHIYLVWFKNLKCQGYFIADTDNNYLAMDSIITYKHTANVKKAAYSVTKYEYFKET